MVATLGFFEECLANNNKMSSNMRSKKTCFYNYQNLNFRISPICGGNLEKLAHCVEWQALTCSNEWMNDKHKYDSTFSRRC